MKIVLYLFLFFVSNLIFIFLFYLIFINKFIYKKIKKNFLIYFNICLNDLDFIAYFTNKIQILEMTKQNRHLVNFKKFVTFHKQK